MTNVTHYVRIVMSVNAEQNNHTKGDINMYTSPEQVMELYRQMAPFYIGTGIVSYILSGIALMKIFEKADVTAWYAWIPFLNIYWITKIATGNGWLFLLVLIPCVGSLIYLILMAIKLSAAFGYGGGMIVLLIFLPIIAYFVIGFGSSQYNGPQ